MKIKNEYITRNCQWCGKFVEDQCSHYKGKEAVYCRYSQCCINMNNFKRRIEATKNHRIEKLRPMADFIETMLTTTDKSPIELDQKLKQETKFWLKFQCLIKKSKKSDNDDLRQLAYLIETKLDKGFGEPIMWYYQLKNTISFQKRMKKYEKMKKRQERIDKKKESDLVVN